MYTMTKTLNPKPYNLQPQHPGAGNPDFVVERQVFVFAGKPKPQKP